MRIYQSPIPDLWVIESSSNGYLLARNGKSILVDCPDCELDFDAYGLPQPELVIHTHVQEEHCREWKAFPNAKVYVPEGTSELAKLSEKFFEETRTVWRSDRNWDARGEEKHGIGGCVTERPPRQALNLFGELHPGGNFIWEDIELEILALPGHGKHSIALRWKKHNVLFSGDLLRRGGYLVNMYDLERAYGLSHGYSQLRESLLRVLKIAPSLILPATGQAIDNPHEDLSALLKRTEWIANPPECENGEPAMLNFHPLRDFGRWHELRKGLFQNNNYGNTVVFVDEAGHGLLLDPDPCVWLGWDESCKAVNDDFDLLEREAGLNSVDYIMFSHYHGDHVQFAPLLRERYGAKTAATADVAAVLKYPERFRYPCALDWYGFPFATLGVDIILEYGKAFPWRDRLIRPVHTQGHCHAHAGFFLEWNAERIACTGDSLQYGSGPLRACLPILYNDAAWPDFSVAQTIRELQDYHPSLLVCGHSHAFQDLDGRILEKFRLVYEEAEVLVAAMLHDGDTMRAMSPPGYEEKRVQLKIL